MHVQSLFWWGISTVDFQMLRLLLVMAIHLSTAQTPLGISYPVMTSWIQNRSLSPNSFLTVCTENMTEQAGFPWHELGGLFHPFWIRIIGVKTFAKTGVCTVFARLEKGQVTAAFSLPKC